MQTIRPAKNQLFVKPLGGETQTKSGLYIPKESAQETRMAEVVNIGDEVKGYKAKEKIIYKPYAMTEIKLNGEDYYLISDEDVLGTVVDVE